MVDQARGANLRGLTPFIARRASVRHDAAAVPTYDYQCRSCGSVTEVIHSMLEEGPSVCERCGGELRRVLYPTGIIFKGSGFYRTDSRNGSKGGAGSEAPKAPDTAGGSGSDPGKTSSPSGEAPKAADSSSA